MPEESFQSPIRYSGYRISLLPEAHQEDTWKARLNDIKPWIPYIQAAMEETFFADDSVIDMPFDVILRNIMTTGELFGCVHDGAVVGFVILRNMRPGRD